jgi:hypothetical protein
LQPQSSRSLWPKQIAQRSSGNGRHPIIAYWLQGEIHPFVALLLSACAQQGSEKSQDGTLFRITSRSQW